MSKYASSLPPLNKGLLIVDNHKVHTYDKLIDDLKKISYEILYLPPNTTDLLQPLDLSINRIYKKNIKTNM